MSSYFQAYQDVVQTGLITESLVRKHVEQHALIDEMLPDAESFFYILEMQTKRYRFMGRQQVKVSGYTNEEFLAQGIQLFLERVHPEDVEILLNKIYPTYVDIVSEIELDKRKQLQLQYNYRFRQKSGNEINLLEQDYILELDESGIPSVILGNIISLHNSEVLPVRAVLKRLNNNGMSETIYYKSFSEKDKSLDAITAREMDILRHLALGKTSREISDQLFISKHTVDTHRRNLLKKLECKSVVELSQVAFSNGLL